MEEDKPKKSKIVSLFKIVLVLLGLLVLFALATSSFKTYRTKDYNSMAKTDLKNFYTAAQSYFASDPKGNINMDMAQKHGFKPTLNVRITVLEGSRDNLKATASHEYGEKTYTINKDGNIEP